MHIEPQESLSFILSCYSVTVLCPKTPSPLDTWIEAMEQILSVQEHIGGVERVEEGRERSSLMTKHWPFPGAWRSMEVAGQEERYSIGDGKLVII